MILLENVTFTAATAEALVNFKVIALTIFWLIHVLRLMLVLKESGA